MLRKEWGEFFFHSGELLLVHICPPNPPREDFEELSSFNRDRHGEVLGSVVVGPVAVELELLDGSFQLLDSSRRVGHGFTLGRVRGERWDKGFCRGAGALDKK